MVDSVINLIKSRKEGCRGVLVNRQRIFNIQDTVPTVLSKKEDKSHTWSYKIHDKRMYRRLEIKVYIEREIFRNHEGPS